VAVRWCRFAQPPANGCDAYGIVRREKVPGDLEVLFTETGLLFGVERVSGIAPTKVPSPTHAVFRIPMANERGASALMVAIFHSAAPPVKIRLPTSAIIKSRTR